MPDDMKGEAAAIYDALRSERNVMLQRARLCALVTLPYLVPLTDESEARDEGQIPLPWNGIGARGVQNLASKMTMSLFPPTESFFRYMLNPVAQAQREDQVMQQKLAEGMDPETATGEVAKERQNFELALGRIEQVVLRSIMASNDRVVAHEAMIHLIVTGNALTYASEDQGLRVYHLNRYVAARDAMGAPLRAVTCELLAVASAPLKVLELLNRADATEPKTATEPDKTCKVYTYIKWDHDEQKVHWHQEVNNRVVRDSEGEVSMEASPWCLLRMTRTDGTPYGVSFVESNCLADLQTLEALTQAVAEGSLIGAKKVTLVKPGGTTRAKDLSKAQNGDAIPGNAADVHTMEWGDTAGLQVAERAQVRLEARLAQAFLLADVRDSERTTATEVSMQAQQIDAGMAGLYGILSVEFQGPYLRRRLYLMQKQGALPKLPDGLVDPVVSVGLASVGRGADQMRIMQFMQALGQSAASFANVPELAMRIDLSELFKRLASATGLDPLGLIVQESQVQAAMQQQQQQAMQQQAMGSAIGDPQKLANAAATVQGMQQQGAPADGAPTDQPPTDQPQ